MVIFDLDNTLLDREVPFRRWATQFVAEHGLAPGEVQWLVNADGDGFVPRPRFLTAVRERYGLDEPLDVLVTSFREQIVALVELDPQVPLALDRLRREGWRVAIATNGNTAQQSAKIRRTGLESHIDALAISEEVGVAKPDPRMFQVAAQRCEARLEDGGWMVGDCPVRDVAGGRDVGLRTIWMRRGRTWDSIIHAPDAIVDDVTAAVAALTIQGC
nr:HAD family hydrolase [Planosporangium thailandense]